MTPHPFAAERVGFISARPASIGGDVLIAAHGYIPVADNDYIDRRGYGAYIGSTAIRKALQFSFNNKASVFHVHVHDHRGVPRFSGIDLAEYPKFVPDFWKVQPALPHGALLLSRDRAIALVWYPEHRRPIPAAEVWSVGTRIERLSA
jgi:hypothetical protein